jgi:acyl-CoA reductase-like NAD-dependent aldehyde dehydrogenase
MSTTVQATEVKTLDNYVDGSWAPATDREALDDIDPFTGEVAAHVPLSEAPEVDARCRRSAARAR